MIESARLNAVEILSDRYNGMSCRDLAQKYGVSEPSIWQLMRETDAAGKVRAKTRQPRRITAKQSDQEIVRDIEAAADELVLERNVAGDRWIATIDDLTGEPSLTIAGAIRSAFKAWKGANDDTQS